MMLVLLITLALFATPRAAAGQQSSRPDTLASMSRKPGEGIETRHLRMTLAAEPAAAAPGRLVTLIADVEPRPGMHVYSPEQKDVVAVALVLDRDPRIRPGARRLPPSEAYFFAPLNETQRVYSRRFRIEQDVRVLDTPAIRRLAADGGSLTIAGVLRYQACDEAVCYLPQNVPVTWTIALDRP